MGSGVFVSIRLQFPRGGLGRWQKQRLTDEPFKLTDNLELLVDQLDSELMDTGLYPRARVSNLLALIRKAHAEGDLFAVVEGQPGKGAFELSGYLDGFDEFSVWFEPLVLLCTAASLHGGTGMAAFVADTELAPEMVFYWLSISPTQVILTDLSAEGSPDPIDEQKIALPDSDLQQITEAYSIWVAGAGRKHWLKRVAGKIGFMAPDGHWGVVDTRGKEVVSPRFNAIEFSGEFFKVIEGGMYGLLNRDGELVVEPRYAGMGGAAESIIPVKETEDALWGYLDVHSQWAIEPRYGAAYDFGNGHALIKTCDFRPGVINTSGTIVTTLDVELDEAGSFAARGVAWIRLGRRNGLVQVDGRVLLDPELEEISGTGADWIRVKYPQQ